MKKHLLFLTLLVFLGVISPIGAMGNNLNFNGIKNRYNQWQKEFVRDFYHYKLDKYGLLGALAANGIMALMAHVLCDAKVTFHPDVYFTTGLIGTAATLPFALGYKTNIMYRAASLVLPCLVTAYGAWQKWRWKYYEYIQIQRDIKKLKSPEDCLKYCESFGPRILLTEGGYLENRERIKTLAFVFKGALRNKNNDIIYWILDLLSTEELFDQPGREETVDYFRKPCFKIITEFFDKKYFDKDQKTKVLQKIENLDTDISTLTAGGKYIHTLYNRAKNDNKQKLCKQIKSYLNSY